MIDETLVLSARALKKWIRNPAAVVPGLVTAIFYIVLFGNSFNPTNLISSGAGGTQLPASALQQSFGGAPTYITYLTAGVICLILVFNMAFGGIDLVLDRQLGFLSTLLTAPIPRAAIFFSGVVQNLVKAMFLALLTFVIALVIPNGLELPSSFGVLDFLGVFFAFAPARAWALLRLHRNRPEPQEHRLPRRDSQLPDPPSDLHEQRPLSLHLLPDLVEGHRGREPDLEG